MLTFHEELKQGHCWRNLFKDKKKGFPTRRVNHDEKKKQIAILKLDLVIFMNEPSDIVLIQKLHYSPSTSNCQRLVFTVGVSQRMHKITKLWKFELNRAWKLRDINERKNTLVKPWSNKVVCFQMLDFETSNSKSEVSKSNLWKITSFSKSTPL